MHSWVPISVTLASEALYWHLAEMIMYYKQLHLCHNEAIAGKFWDQHEIELKTF